MEKWYKLMKRCVLHASWLSITLWMSLRKLKDPNNGIDGNFLEARSHLGDECWTFDPLNGAKKDSHVEAAEPCSSTFTIPWWGRDNRPQSLFAWEELVPGPRQGREPTGPSFTPPPSTPHLPVITIPALEEKVKLCFNNCKRKGK